MIRAVIFDCFGVLTTDGWQAFCHRYFASTPDKFEQARTLNIQVDRGMIDYETFLQGAAELAGIPYDAAKQQIERSAANEELFTYIRDTTAPRYAVGLLSNAGANWLNDLFEPWQVALFNETVLSYEIGVAKPDPRIYDAIASRLGVLPEECVFIDDVARYVDAAKATGMQGITFVSTRQCIDDLERIGS